jgi:hypothetical protein
VTTFAYLQDLYVRGKVGFEASVLTMNTRAATLFEGIANNAILIAHGVTEVDQLPDEDLQIGVLLALLQDDAKNQSSYLTWGDGVPQQRSGRHLRRDFLVTESARASSPAHGDAIPLLGRMYLPAYRAWIGNRLFQSQGWAGLVRVSSRWFSYSTYGSVMAVVSLSFLFGDAGCRWMMSELMAHGVGWRGVFFFASGALAVLMLTCLLLLREAPEERGLPRRK